jgi:hypothetical protein
LSFFFEFLSKFSFLYFLLESSSVSCWVCNLFFHLVMISNNYSTHFSCTVTWFYFSLYFSFNFERNYLHSLRNPKIPSKSKEFNNDRESSTIATSSISINTATTSIPREYNPNEWRGKTPKTLLTEFRHAVGSNILRFEFSSIPLKPPVRQWETEVHD